MHSPPVVCCARTVPLPSIVFDLNTNHIAVFPSEMTMEMLGRMSTSESGSGHVFSPTIIPGGRAGTEEDMAGTILYLASRAGAYLSGCAIVLDGGRLSVLPSAY